MAKKKSEEVETPVKAKKIRRAKLSRDDIASVVRKAKTCLRSIESSLASVEDAWLPLEFDGANQGAKAADQLQQFAANLGKAITKKSLDE